MSNRQKKNRKRNPFVGTGTDIASNASRPVLRGEAVFIMMDSQGLPFDFIMDQCKEREWGFDVLGFVCAAHRSKNFTKKRLRDLFILNQPNLTEYPDFIQQIDSVLNLVYGEEK